MMVLLAAFCWKSAWNDGIMECWNICIFKPIIPRFHHSISPLRCRSAAVTAPCPNLQVAVELRTVDTGEQGLVPNLHATTAAHAGAVDHDRVEANDRLDVERPGVSAQNFIMIAGPMA